MNLASLNVDVMPDRAALVCRSLLEMAGVEVHAATPEGKLIVTVEADSDAGLVAIHERIVQVDGVMSVALVYHQFDPDPDQEVPDGTHTT